MLISNSGTQQVFGRSTATGVHLALLTDCRKQQYISLTGLMPQGVFNFN
jgi:hypothetical protein